MAIFQLLINNLDYSTYVNTATSPIKIVWGLNQPQIIDIDIVSEDPTFGGLGIPKREYSVVLHTYKYGNFTFKGNISEQPKLELLGYKPGQFIFNYKIQATSEERQLNSASRKLSLLPGMAGRTSGDIIKAMTEFILPGKFDYSNVATGFYQPNFGFNAGDMWSDIAKKLADADGYHYWILNSQIFYAPLNDTSLGCGFDVSTDASITGWNESSLQVTPRSTSIKNDVIVVGGDSPKGKGRLDAIDDGYTGKWPLQQQAWGIERQIIVDETWQNSNQVGAVSTQGGVAPIQNSGNLNTNIWEVQDLGSNIVQGMPNLQFIGGQGFANSYVRLRRAIDLGVSIRLTHGELQLTGASDGLVGCLYKDFTSTAISNLLCGFRLTKSGENLMANSEAADNWTSNTGVTVTANAVVSPTGTLTADRVVYNGSGAPGGFRIAAGLYKSVLGQYYTVSVWMRSTVPVSLMLNPNIGTGTLVNVTTAWQRFSVTVLGDGTQFVQLVLYSSSGNALFDVYVWGGQINRGVFPSNYTATVATLIDLGSTLIQPITANNSVIENRLRRSEDFTQSVWQGQVTGGASAPVVSNIGNQILPNGVVSNCSQLVFPTTAGGATSNLFQVSNILSPIPGSNYCFSVYLKATVACTITIVITKTNAVGAQVCTPLVCNVTTNWQQFFVFGDASIDVTQQLCGVLLQPASSASVTILAWGALINAGSSPAPYNSTAQSALSAPSIITNSAGFGHNYVLITRIHGHKVRSFQANRTSRAFPSVSFGNQSLQDLVRVSFEVWDYTITPTQALQVLDPVITKLGETDLDLSSLVSPFVAYVVCAVNDFHLAINFTEIAKPMQAHCQSQKPVLDINGLPITWLSPVQRSLGIGLDRADATVTADTQGHQLSFFSLPVDNLPVACEKVQLAYSIAGRAMGRVSSAASIAQIAALYGTPDNGLRTAVILDAVPQPHSDDDAVSLAAAKCNDFVAVQYDGTYVVNSNYCTTRPIPGRYLLVNSKRLEDAPRTFIVNSVQQDIVGDHFTKQDNHSFTISFGDILESDIFERSLIVKQSNLFIDGRDISQTTEIDILAVQTKFLKQEVTNWIVTPINAVTFSIQVLTGFNSNVGLYLEARRWDRSWGAELKFTVPFANIKLEPVIGAPNNIVFNSNIVDANIVSDGMNVDTALTGNGLAFDCGSPVAIQEIKLYTLAAAHAGIYRIQYSDDDTSYTDSITNWSPVDAGWNGIWWPSVGAHRWWKIVLMNTPGATAHISEIVLSFGSYDAMIVRAGKGQTVITVPRQSRRQLFYMRWWKWSGDSVGSRVYSGHSGIATIAYPLVPAPIIQALATLPDLSTIKVNYSIPISNFQDIWRIITKRRSDGSILDNFIWRAEAFTYQKTFKYLRGVQISLASSFNLLGIVADGFVFSSGIDSFGLATTTIPTCISSTLLGSSISFNGVSFTFGANNVNNAVSCTGQTILLTNGAYYTLRFIAICVNGNQTGQVFQVNYSDASNDTFTQSMSDWFTPQNYAGESKAFLMAYRNASDGSTQILQMNLYEYELAVNAAKTVVSITLPNNQHVVLLAISLVSTLPNTRTENIDIYTYNTLGETAGATTAAINIPLPQVSAPSVNEGINEIEWTAINAGNGILSYRLQIASDNAFSSILVDVRITVTQYRYDLTFTDIRYMRVLATDNLGDGSWSGTTAYSVTTGVIWQYQRFSPLASVKELPYNGDFEQFPITGAQQLADGWSTTDADSTGAGCALARSSTAFSGLYSQSMTNNSNTGGQSIMSRPFAVTPGMIFQVVFKVKVLVINTTFPFFRIDWFADDSNFAHAVVGFPFIRYDSGPAVSTSITTWQQFLFQAVAPINARYARIELYNWNPASVGNTAGTALWDGITVIPSLDMPSDAVIFDSLLHDINPTVTYLKPLAGAGVQVDLSSYVNRDGIYITGAVFTNTSGYDTSGFALRRSLIGSSVTFNGVVFNTIAFNGPSSNILACNGQVITIPQDGYYAIQLLGSAVITPRTNQVFVISYSDGTTQSFTQSMSEWGVFNAYTAELVAVTYTARDKFDGTTDTTTIHLYRYEFVLDPTKQVVSLTVPVNLNLNIVAITMLPGRAIWTNTAIRGNWAFLIGAIGNAFGINWTVSGVGIKFIVTSSSVDLYRIYVQFLDNVPSQVLIGLHLNGKNWATIYWGTTESFASLVGPLTPIFISTLPSATGNWIELTFSSAQAGLSAGDCIDNVMFGITAPASTKCTVVFSDIVVNTVLPTINFRRPLGLPLTSSSFGRQASILPGNIPAWSSSSTYDGGSLTSDVVATTSAKSCGRSDGSIVAVPAIYARWTNQSPGITVKLYPYWSAGFDGRVPGVHWASGATVSPTSPDLDPNNLFIYSNQFNQAAWVKDGGSTITTGIADPINGTTACTLTKGAGAFADFGILYQKPALDGSIGAYTFSIWLRVAAGSVTVTIAVGDYTVKRVSVNVVVTTTWQRFSVTANPAQLTNTGFTSAGVTVLPGAAGTTLQVWRAQLETAYNPGSYNDQGATITPVSLLSVSTDSASMNQNTDGRIVLSTGPLTIVLATVGGGSSGSGGSVICIEQHEYVKILERGVPVEIAKPVKIYIRDVVEGDYIRCWDFDSDCYIYRCVVSRQREFCCRWHKVSGILMTAGEEVRMCGKWIHAYDCEKEIVYKSSFKIQLRVHADSYDNHNFIISIDDKELIVHNWEPYS